MLYVVNLDLRVDLVISILAIIISIISIIMSLKRNRILRDNYNLNRNKISVESSIALLNCLKILSRIEYFDSDLSVHQKNLELLNNYVQALNKEEVQLNQLSPLIFSWCYKLEGDVKSLNEVKNIVDEESKITALVNYESILRTSIIISGFLIYPYNKNEVINKVNMQYIAFKKGNEEVLMKNFNDIRLLMRELKSL